MTAWPRVELRKSVYLWNGLLSQPPIRLSETPVDRLTES
jgi:hypothetical protein